MSAVERLEEFLVNPAKAAVGHEDHDIAGAMLADNRSDDVLDDRDVTGALPLPAEVVDQTLGGQALRFRKRRPKDAGDDDFVGGAEHRGEVVLEDPPA
jgi:hypothetical protein